MRRTCLIAITAAAALSTSLLTAAPAAPAAPAAATDAPNRCTQARRLVVGTWAGDTLGRSGDVDWYKVRLTGDRRVRAVLGSLPANYKLELFGQCGQALGLSKRTGPVFEEILRSVSAGTYRLKVSNQRATVFDQRYQVRVQALPRGVKVLGKPRVYRRNGFVHMAGELVNNTPARRESVRLRVRFIDGRGRVVKRGSVGTYQAQMGVHQRQPFHLTVQTRADFVRAKVSVVSQRADDRAEFLRVRDLRASSSVDRLRYSGTIVNPNRFSVDRPSVATTAYDRRGEVANTDRTFGNRNRLAPKGSTTFADAFGTQGRDATWLIVTAQGT